MKNVKENNVTVVSNIIKDNMVLIKSTDMIGETPLHWACKRGYCDMVELLCSYGASLYVKNFV